MEGGWFEGFLVLEARVCEGVEGWGEGGCGVEGGLVGVAWVGVGYFLQDMICVRVIFCFFLVVNGDFYHDVCVLDICCAGADFAMVLR